MPVLASDLLLYLYQLYRLRFAGADAVALGVGALPAKDLLYLAKIATALGMQTVLSATSEAQVAAAAGALKKGSISCVVLSNRNLEDYSFDDTREKALRLLRSAELVGLSTPTRRSGKT